MSIQRIDGPTQVGVLSCLPLEVRQGIYDDMCRLDSPVYEFEVEGPNNLHITAATLEGFEKKEQRIPRIAHVCTEMRDYVLGSALSPIEFTCYVFGMGSHPMSSRYEEVIERRSVKSFFRFKSDTLSFKPHQMANFEVYDLGEGDDYDFIQRNLEAQRRIRVFLFPGSGGLPSSSPEGGTRFEEFVWARRDDYVAEYPESATALRITRDNKDTDGNHKLGPELIEQHGYPSTLMLRFYDLSHLHL